MDHERALAHAGMNEEARSSPTSPTTARRLRASDEAACRRLVLGEVSEDPELQRRLRARAALRLGRRSWRRRAASGGSPRSCAPRPRSARLWSALLTGERRRRGRARLHSERHAHPPTPVTRCRAPGPPWASTRCSPGTVEALARARRTPTSSRGRRPRVTYARARRPPPERDADARALEGDCLWREGARAASCRDGARAWRRAAGERAAERASGQSTAQDPRAARMGRCERASKPSAWTQGRAPVAGVLTRCGRPPGPSRPSSSPCDHTLERHDALLR